MHRVSREARVTHRRSWGFISHARCTGHRLDEDMRLHMECLEKFREKERQRNIREELRRNK